MPTVKQELESSENLENLTESSYFEENPRKSLKTWIQRTALKIKWPPILFLQPKTAELKNESRN